MASGGSSHRPIDPHDTHPFVHGYTGDPAPEQHDGDALPAPDSAAANPPQADVASTADATPDDMVHAEQPTVISKHLPLADEPLTGPAAMIRMGKTLQGQMLEHFRLEEYIGGGGMGAVFRATDTVLDRTVAVKVLSQDQSADEEALRRFRNEALSAARLEHDNIARVHHVGEDRGWNFIVFEYIKGVNVRDLVEQRGPLPLEEAVSYALQTAEALAHAAKRDVVHRDIKPSNILITPEGKAKLVDMGLARFHTMQPSQDDLTASGVTLGTFDYISPEQARDPRGADVRSDLYSLGCTLFFMLTGRPPFPEGTVLQKLLSHTSDPPPDARYFRPDLPDEVGEIIGRMMQKRPEQRYQQPSELVGALLMLIERYHLHANHGGMLWVTPSQSRYEWLERHAPWIIPGVTLLVVVFGLQVFSSWTTPDGAPPEFVMPVEPPQPEVEPAAPEPSPPEPVETPSDGDDTEQPAPAGDASATPDAPEPDVDDNASPPEPTTPDPAAQSDLVADGALQPAPVSGEISAAVGADPATGDDGEPAGGISVADTPTDPPSGDAALQPPPDTIVVMPQQEAMAGSPRVVGSLRQAVRLAQQSPGITTIELRFDGPLEEPPLSLFDATLTIRAADGHRPVVVFQPEVGDPAVHPRRMIEVVGGELQLDGVHLQFHVPRVYYERWALFELQQVALLRLSDCAMTIVNTSNGRSTYVDGVAFINVRAASANGDYPWPVGDIELHNCVARGAATLLTADESLPLRLMWRNGLLATTQRLAELGGARQPPADGEHVTIDLDHVTAVADAGLCLLTRDTGGTAPYPMIVDVKCTNSILMTDDQPLIWQRGADIYDSQPEFRRQLLFWGQRNFYEGTEILWRIQNILNDELFDDDFIAWQQRWEERDELPKRGKVRWQQLPAADRPTSTLTPLDYALDEQRPGNSAVGGAADRRNAGCRAETLPLVPPPSPTAEASDEPAPTTVDESPQSRHFPARRWSDSPSRRS